MINFEALNKKKIELMQKNNVVIDDHTGNMVQIVGLVEFINPNKGLACCFKSRYYTLYKCTLHANGMLHCSRTSIGGLFFGYPTSEKIKEYNDNCMFNGANIRQIHLSDGTIISA